MTDRLVQTRPTGHGRARGLVSSRQSGSRVQARSFAPSPSLSPVVATYWAGAWDLRGQAPHVTELLGDPCVHFVFEQGDGEHAGSRVVGVWTRLWRRTLQGQGRVRGVKLRSGAMRAFVDEPAFRLSNRITPLRSVFGDEADALYDAVWHHDDDAQAFEPLDAWLRSRWSRHDSVATAVALVERIVGDPEVTTVDALSTASGLGVRALQRLFRDWVGASPKWVIRRNRLQEVALRIEKGELLSLAALAAELHYTDQAHLARDFKRVVGISPSAFAASVHR